MISFCTEGDLLSQWRGYGNAEASFAIGFNMKKLMKCINSNLFSLQSCRYLSVEQHNEIVDEFTDKVLYQIKQEGELPEAGTLLNAFLEIATTLKYDCFKEENEWRLVSSVLNENELEFRVCRSSIIPYYPLKINLSSISEIIIGPCKHQYPLLLSVSQLADKVTKGHTISVKESQIPYRPI